MIGGVQKCRSLTKIVKKVPLAIYLEVMCIVISLNVVFGVWLQARWPKGSSQMDKVSQWGLSIYSRYVAVRIDSSAV